MPETYKQNDSHDWLGDAAEAYVRYCFAADDFEVFGSGKWAVDAAVRDRESGRWWRVEVKSTDHPQKRPGRKSLDQLSEKAELFAQVRIVRGKPITLRLTKLREDDRGEGCFVEDKGDIKKFLEK